MSDLQDLIATNAVRAYNEGFERGATEERERIIKLLEEAREAQPCGCDDCGDHVWGKAIELIKGDQE